MFKNYDCSIPVLLPLLQTIGVGYADASTHLLGISQFIDNEVFTNLESILIQLNVKEAVVSDEGGNYEMNKLRDVVEKCGVVLTERKKGNDKGKQTWNFPSLGQQEF